MTDSVITSLRQSTYDAIQLCIDLCIVIRDSGGCANCCVNELSKTLAEVKANDITRDLLEKVQRG